MRHAAALADQSEASSAVSLGVFELDVLDVR